MLPSPGPALILGTVPDLKVHGFSVQCDESAMLLLCDPRLLVGSDDNCTVVHCFALADILFCNL